MIAPLTSLFLSGSTPVSLSLICTNFDCLYDDTQVLKCLESYLFYSTKYLTHYILRSLILCLSLILNLALSLCLTMLIFNTIFNTNTVFSPNTLLLLFRILELRRTPLAVGRRLDIKNDIQSVATEGLLSTFFNKGNQRWPARIIHFIGTDILF